MFRKFHPVYPAMACAALLTALPWALDDGPFMNKVYCLGGDRTTLGIWSLLCFLITSCYVRIAYRSWKMWRKWPESEGKKVYSHMVLVFLLSAACSYAFPLLAITWPAYRLKCLLMVILFYYAFRLSCALPALDNVFTASFREQQLIRQQKETSASLQSLEKELKEIKQAREILEGTGD